MSRCTLRRQRKVLNIFPSIDSYLCHAVRKFNEKAGS